MKFKHVKFSRRTAKDNPEMIVREYERLISQANNDIKSFLDKEKNKVTVRVDKNKIIHQVNESNDYYHGNLLEFKLEFDYKELIDIVKKMESNNEAEIERMDYKEELVREFREFKEIYI